MSEINSIANGTYTINEPQSNESSLLVTQNEGNVSILQGTVATSAGIVGDGSTQNPLRADETVLWSDTTNGLTSGSLVLNEPWSGFERIRLHVVDKFGWGGSCIEYDTTNLDGARTKHFACTYSFIVTGSPNKTYNRGILLEFANGQYISGSSVGLETVFTPTSTIDSKTVTGGPSLIKVIGINRINNT